MSWNLCLLPRQVIRTTRMILMESVPSADMEHLISYWLHEDQASSFIPIGQMRKMRLGDQVTIKKQRKELAQD